MTVFAIVIGSLFKQPESRTSKDGKVFATATIKVRDGNAMQFVRLVAFSETAQAELLRLKDGDSVSAQGVLKAEIYTPTGGEPRVSLSLVAEQVLALRQHPKERQAKAAKPEPQAARPRQDRLADSWTPGAGPDDENSVLKGR
jgi:single-stranded DNA-binding protein